MLLSRVLYWLVLPWCFWVTLLTFLIISVAVAVLSLLTYFNLELRSLLVPPDSNLRAEEPLRPVTAKRRY